MKTVRVNTQGRIDEPLARGRGHVHVPAAAAAGERRDRREESQPAWHCPVIIATLASMRRPAASRIAVATTIAAFACGCASASTTTPARTAPAPVPLARMVGQLMLVRMQGQAPSPAFRARIRRGEIGGVVLFTDNYGAAGPAALVAQLQRIALGAGQPRLLIAIDQEGGVVRRLPGAPTLKPSQMTNARIATQQGLATAQNLKRNGVGVDLAPVLDVGRGGFITERMFGSTPLQVANRVARLHVDSRLAA